MEFGKVWLHCIQWSCTCNTPSGTYKQNFLLANWQYSSCSFSIYNKSYQWPPNSP